MKSGQRIIDLDGHLVNVLDAGCAGPSIEHFKKFLQRLGIGLRQHFM